MGTQVRFSPSSCSIIAFDVCEAIRHLFTTGRLLRASNTYFLSLIPKSSSSKSFSDFRPISMLNFSYKIISKILASRLSFILPNLISYPRMKTELAAGVAALRQNAT
eukprot:TRINITY_DN8362_c0_g1_i2.p1 TRINITY_DN8362_c0_g1~~TRINITY_DN8362_c0_g1_i2.p1  ORF type:complete len:107 (-),score=1.61 TRINITY_DN8362_c0_g1_i2:67-387(-)